MSWKSTLWSWTKTVGKVAAKVLVVPWVVSKIHNAKVAGAVNEVLGGLLNDQPIAPKLQGYVNGFLATQRPDTDAENKAKLRQALGAGLENAALSEQARALRDRGRK